MNLTETPYAYTYLPDWNSEDETVAVAYIGNLATIRLTDLHRIPVKGGYCCMTNDVEEHQYPIDSNGTITVKLLDANQERVDLVWTSPNGDFEPWKEYGGTFFLDIRSKDDDDCLRRLTNLGFYGANDTDRIKAFEQYLGRTPTGNLASIREELVEWHDGGRDPSKPTEEEKLAGVEISDDALLDLYEAIYGEPHTGYKAKGLKFKDAYPIICKYNREGTMNNLIRDWRSAFNSDLETIIYDSFKEDDLKQVLHKFYQVPDDRIRPEEYPSPPPGGTYDPNWVTRLHDAFDHGLFGWATDEDEIYTVLALARKEGMMNKLRMEYNNEYDKRTLEEEFYRELSQNSDKELQRALQPYYLGLTEASQGADYDPELSTLINLPPPLPSGTCFCHGTLVPQFGYTLLNSLEQYDPLNGFGPFVKTRNLRPLFPDFFQWIYELNQEVDYLKAPPAETSGSESSGSGSSSGLGDLMTFEVSIGDFSCTVELPSKAVMKLPIHLQHGYNLRLEVKAEASGKFSLHVLLDGMEDFTLAFNSEVTISSGSTSGTFGLKFDSTRKVDHVVLPKPDDVKDKVNAAVEDLKKAYSEYLEMIHTDEEAVPEPEEENKEEEEDGILPPPIEEYVDSVSKLVDMASAVNDIYSAIGEVTEPEKKKVSLWSVGLTFSMIANKDEEDASVGSPSDQPSIDPGTMVPTPVGIPEPSLEQRIMLNFTLHF